MENSVEKVVENEVVEEKVEIPAEWKFGISPYLTVHMVKETRSYKFEMPVGARLEECVQACEECLTVVKKMLEEAIVKEAEAKKKEEVEQEVHPEV